MRCLLFLGTIGILLAPPLLAQRPGDELPAPNRAREEYLAATFRDIKEFVTEWHKGFERRDAKALAKLFTRDGLYQPLEGWYTQGRQEVQDSLALRVAKVHAYHTTFLDFTASGSLAYYMGRLFYRYGDPAGPTTDVSGTFVMILYLDGQRWRIRSYVEQCLECLKGS